MTAPAMPPLAGVRVLDFTWVVAGPVATRILADAGAEVIKVERRALEYVGPRRAGQQADLNRGKLSVAIDMASARGLELARRLAGISDIVIDNFSARVMSNWGMDYASLARLKPDIICISMSGLGHTGPLTGYVSFGPTLQALTGFTRLMAGEGGEPAGYGYSYSDMVGGYTGALAALFALWHRQRTGQGQFIDLSQLEALTGVIGPALLDISVNGRVQDPVGYHPQERLAAPHGVYRCAPEGDDSERWIAISVRTQAEWERFSGTVGSPQWARDPRFQTLYLRMHNQAELDRNVARWCAERTAEAAMASLQAAGIAAGLVANGADLCERDPQLESRDFFSVVSLPDGETTRVSGPPFRLSRTPVTVRARAPEVGENRDYVLGGLLKLSREEIEALVRDGVVTA